MSKSGTRSFYVRVPKRFGKGSQRITIGKYPILSLVVAREKAREILAKAMNGTLHTQQQKEITVSEAHNNFIELYAKVKNKDWRVSGSRLARFLDEYGCVNLGELKRCDIVGHLDKLMAMNIPTQANRAHAALSRFLNWCVERDYIEISPCHGVKKPAPENPRDRVLSDQELSSIWAVCESIAYPFGPLFQVMILTAQRRSEVSAMRWAEINFNEKTWTIPKERVKNAKMHIVPLSDVVIKILKSLPRFLHSDYVFTTTGRTPVSGHGKYKYRLDEETGVSGWVFHDFRRTAASRMAKLEVSPYVVEKVLNHVSGTFAGVLGVYNQYGYDKEKRDALDKWADYVVNIKNGIQRSTLYS